MRVLIVCAGGAKRWGDFRGVPKHLIELAGEPILQRTIRLCAELAPSADIKVVVRDLRDRRYLIPGSSRTVAKVDDTLGDVDKIASSRHQWDTTDRTVILMGDVWWSNDAITSILTDPVDGWAAWLRFGPNGIGGELFGFAFDPAEHDRFDEAIALVARAHRRGRMDGIPGGWALYRKLHGRPVADHANHGHAVIIDDWTEDMDVPDDWHAWCERWAFTPESERPT